MAATTQHQSSGAHVSIKTTSIAAAIAAGAATLLTHPADVIKTRAQLVSPPRAAVPVGSATTPVAALQAARPREEGFVRATIRIIQVRDRVCAPQIPLHHSHGMEPSSFGIVLSK